MNMILRLIAILAAALIAANAAHAQSLRAGSFLGNPSSSARSPTDATASQMFDRNFGSTNGYVIKRQNGTWLGVPDVKINVMEAPYSATCNGSANDTTAFNAALVAANAAGGGIVTAPDGKVCIIQTATTILMQSNTCIKGNFTLRGTSATNNTEMIIGVDKTNICVEDVTIDMIDSFVDGNNNNAAMSFQGTSLTALTVRIKNVKVINQGNFGLLINGGTFWVLDNRFTMNSPYGVVSGIGRQNQSIQTACSLVSTGIIDRNVASGSAMSICSQAAQITNNQVTTWSYGSGIGHGVASGGAGGPCTIKDLVGAVSCGSVIAFNVLSGGLGIDDNVFVNSGIETYDPQNIVVGNRISNLAGTGIIGAAASMSNNVIHDICTYYQTAAISGGCYGIFLRKDGDGSYTSLSSNKVIASFGAPMAVTGTTNSAGVIRITVASTATVGATNTSVPCRVSSVGGTTNANKGWAACVVKSSTSIELTGSVFNSAWTSGGTIGPMMDYAYGENNANMPGITMSANTFFSGLTGTYDLLNPGTTATNPLCTTPCTASDGTLMVGLGGSNVRWVSRSVTGDWTMSSTGVATLATVNSNVGTFGSATQVGQFTVNAKGLITAASGVTVTPAVGSITGLGTGVATALGVNVGSAGAFVTFNGALGTPSSGTLTNATGLPVSSGISGLGTNVATALAVNVGTAGAFVVNGGALGSPSSAGTLPAHTLGGTVSGGGNQINNVIIGTSTPLAGSFTTVSASSGVTAGPATDAVVASVTSAASGSDLKRVANFVSSNLTNGDRIYLNIGKSAASNEAMFQVYNHNSTAASRRWSVQAFEAGDGQALSVYADGGVSVGGLNNSGFGTVNALNGFVIATSNKTLTFKQGANGAVGTFVCTSGGTITINNTFVAVTDHIIISLNTAGGTVSTPPAVSTVTAATSFQAKCATSDTSTYNYAILKNAA